jgi:uncharacterized protein (UPF0332 family)
VPFPSDLLEQAQHLAQRERNRPKQASLRRAVSTAYYSLFHLLISETVAYWRLENQRSTLARAFEHGKMKNASRRCDSTNAGVKAVADAFVQLQQVRHLADYDNNKLWTRVEVNSHINTARNAFIIWSRIREAPDAQDYLLSLLVERK